ncbi:hypothetical protein PSPO01_09246 [Paraphaeosphaeria sporulosa]
MMCWRCLAASGPPAKSRFAASNPSQRTRRRPIFALVLRCPWDRPTMPQLAADIVSRAHRRVLWAN